jgi:hypothetical protein
MKSLSRTSLLIIVLLGLAPSPVSAEGHTVPEKSNTARFPAHVYWGDTHVHSSWSPDAGGSGNERLTPIDAFRFAKGESVTAHNGQSIRLRRPLDFLLVSDHAEYLGLYPLLEQQYPPLLATERGAHWAKLIEEGRRSRVGGEFAVNLAGGKDLIGDRSFVPMMWNRVVENADQMNEPGKFTAFVGYEWTSMPATANLHRNVLFREGGEYTAGLVPFTSIESQDPEALWAFLAAYEARTGGRVMAIPHNSNMSAGRMFETTAYEGGALDRDYAERRMRFERIVEATQIKGDSEAAPFLSPDDEFADFGTWDAMRGMGGVGPHENWMYAGEYVRPALGRGQALARNLGENPFEFGLIGSTDAHTSLATADDDNFWGKFSSNEPHANRATERFADLDLPEIPGMDFSRGENLPDQLYTWSLVASGYAAVWASENTRAALFDAMARRETYATTGPRMIVRFFGGWGFEKKDADQLDIASTGYAGGVPMGSRLAPRPPGASGPRFLISALRDPQGGNLDRAQVVKLWVDAESGESRERIFDVAVSDGRSVGADGRCRTPVGNSVDIDAATYSNDIGDGTLVVAWADPDFDPATRALYYVRVLEIPTPRWTTYDAVRFGTPRPPKAPATIQQRAYTSPIWYVPGG